jgi:hypothetical protein
MKQPTNRSRRKFKGFLKQKMETKHAKNLWIPAKALL